MYEQKFGILQINRRAVEFFAELDGRVDLIPETWKFDRLENQRAAGLIQ
jgi:hypothetical protein